MSADEIRAAGGIVPVGGAGYVQRYEGGSLYGDADKSLSPAYKLLDYLVYRQGMSEQAARQIVELALQEPNSPELQTLTPDLKEWIASELHPDGSYYVLQGEGITPQIVSREDVVELQGLRPGSEEYHNTLISLGLIPEGTPYVDPVLYNKAMDALKPYIDPDTGTVDIVAVLKDEKIDPAYLDAVLGADAVARVKQQLAEFEQHNVRLADGSYIPVDTWDKLDEKYRTIGLERGLDAIQNQMTTDWLENQVATGQAKDIKEAERQLSEIQSGSFLAYDPATKEYVPVWSEFIKQREVAGYTPEELDEIYSGQYKVLDSDSGKFVNVTKEQYEQQNYQTAEQAYEQETVKARADVLPKPEQTYTYRDPSGIIRIVTEDERKAILDEKGWSSSYYDRFTRDTPVIQDVAREAMTLGKMDTMTFNRDDLAKQYENQKDIALAILTGNIARLNELYQAGAFGKDEKIPTWWYKGREIGADERARLLAESDANRDYMTVARGISTPPQAYKDALAAVQQQKDIEVAVKAGDVSRLEQLYQEGAFGDDLDAYVNLAKYVEEGGRELAPVTAQDVKAVSEGFGTKKEYVDAVLAMQPTTTSMVKDTAIAIVPVYGTIYLWDRMGTGMKAVSIATDALSLIPIVGGISAAAKVAAGTGRSARLASAMKVVPKLVTREVIAPIETALHPVQTAKALGSTAKGLSNILNPRHIPDSTLSTAYSTVRLDTAILGDPVATMHVRDQLMALQAAGKKPVVQFGDKVFTLRSGSFLDEGGVVHASPDIRFTGEPEGFIVSAKTYPEGHPKAGQRLPDSEQGMFVANVALDRFATGGSAFGFEKRVSSATENIKAITDATERARALGDIKKANKLTKLVDDYNVAIASKNIKALDKAEGKIVRQLADIAEDEIVAQINAARTTAGKLYAIGDIKGAQEAMQEALSYEKQLQKARPGFAIFSPEVNEILVPSGKTYTGMVFQPKAGEFWSIAMTEMKQDKAAQLLKQAHDAAKLGDKATAAKLTKEAQDLISEGKSGFRRVETAEMELKFPELTQMQQLKPTYTTTAPGAGTKLWIYTTEPYSLKKALRAKLMAPIDTLRNIYDPAIRVRTIPMTKAQKLARIEELLEQAKVADKAKDATQARLLRAEADVIQRSLSPVKGVVKADDIASAVARAKRMDDANELIQSAKRAEAVGDYASADRLRRAADAIAGRRYVDAIARRAGTVSGLAEYARALGTIRLDDREVPISEDIPYRATGLPDHRLGEPMRDTAKELGRTDARAGRPSPRVPEAGVLGLRSPIAPDAKQSIEPAKVGRELDVVRTTDTGEISREPVERGTTDTRLPRDADVRIARYLDGQRIPDTGRTPETTRILRTPQPYRYPREITDREMTDTTATRLKLQGVSIDKGQARLPDNSVVWRQGMFWKWIPREDFVNGAKPRTLPRGITPVGAKFTDLRTPQETIQIVGDTGISVPDFYVDLGKTDVFISNQAQTIRYTGKGEKTNVGKRVASTTQGMSVEDGNGGNGGSTGISRPDMTDYYPEHSVSRPHIVKTGTEPVRNGSARETQGKDRVDITERTEQMLSGDYDNDYEDYEVAETAKAGSAKPKSKRGDTPYFDEDPEWLDSLEPDVLRTKKKAVNRVKLNRQKSRKVMDNATVIRSMRSR